MCFITIRTDVAWYRLATPSEKYAPWFNTVVKTARVAAKVLGWLSEESRASKLSFADVVKRLAAEAPGAPAHVGKRPDGVERFVVVHAPVILGCFAAFPLKAVANSAFASALKERLNTVRTCRLYRAAPRGSCLKARTNRNPMKDRAAGGRAKPMTATATRMVKDVWSSYFRSGGVGPDSAPKAEGEEGLAKAVEEDENEEEDEAEVEDALAAPAKGRAGAAGGTGKAAAAPKKAAAKKPAAKAAAAAALVGAPARTEGGLKFFAKARAGGAEVALGAAVELAPEAGDESDEEEEGGAPAPPLGLLQALWQDGAGAKFVQVRVLVRGADTVLGDAASDSELFLTTRTATRPLAALVGAVNATRLDRAWLHAKRGDYFEADLRLRERNEAAAAAGKPLELFWRRQYVPEKGMFADPPADLAARLGERLPEAPAKPDAVPRALPGGAGFTKDGVEYRVGDFLFVGPEVFDQMPEAQRDVNLPEYLTGKFHKGSHVGLRAWGVGRLVKLGAASAKPAPKKGAKKGGEASDDEDDKSKDADFASKKGKGKAAAAGAANRVERIAVRRFWRPEDISLEAAYSAASFSDVYASDEVVTVDADEVFGKCAVVPAGAETSITAFACVGTFSRKTKKISPPPSDIPAPAPPPAAAKAAAAKGKGKASAADKGKGKAGAAPAPMDTSGGSAFPGDDGVSLATMDIFAGCGGLSEGMHQAGAAHTRWAVEYESPAADAFRLNYPEAATFCNNCNVLLHAAMAKAGAVDDCEASPEAAIESAALPTADVEALPRPGEVDFICGGPPCQVRGAAAVLDLGR
jgi:DNA (cytosine-5)-methyltransferase 1